MPDSLPRRWQEVDVECHYSHWWRDLGCPMITAMNINDIAAIVLIVSVLVAVVGGLGFAGIGNDSRGLDPRPHSDELPNRSLLS
jgi:hypothetical protein